MDFDYTRLVFALREPYIYKMELTFSLWLMCVLCASKVILMLFDFKFVGGNRERLLFVVEAGLLGVLECVRDFVLFISHQESVRVNAGENYSKSRVN